MHNICSIIILSVSRQPCCFWHEQPESGGVTRWSGVWHQLWRSSLTDQPAWTRCAACERAAGAVFVWPHPCGRGLQGDHPHDSTVSGAACWTPLCLFTTQHGLNLLYYYHNNSSIYAAHNLVCWHYSIHNLYRQLKEIRKRNFRGGGGSSYWQWARCCLFSTDNGLGVVLYRQWARCCLFSTDNGLGVVQYWQWARCCLFTTDNGLGVVYYW